MTSNREEKSDSWGMFTSNIICGVIGHPIEYGKVLIQLGHEPIPPTPSKTLLGKPVLILPNVFRYVNHIYSVDGFAGCFRGLNAKICASLASSYTIITVHERLKVQKRKNTLHRQDSETWRTQDFLDSLSIQLISHSAGVVISHPFHVICVRMMAEFVGRETYYSSIISAIREIYAKEGVMGFYSGMFPRWIGDLLNVTLTAIIGALIYRCLPESEDMKNYANAIAGFVASAITYPCNLVSNCMIVSSSGLAAGSPPHMPEYRSWVQCWGHLYRTNQLKRGSSILWRYYKGPYILLNGQPVMVNKEEFAYTVKLRG